MNWLVLIGLAVAGVGVILRLNARDLSLQGGFKPVTSDDQMEALFAKYQDLIGNDFPGYRNHCYRVYSYAIQFLGGKISDSEKNVLITALVYHDIGLWTDSTLAYLEPSSARATELFKNEYNAEQLQLLHDIIYWHHKITPFKGPHEDLVNAVRMADWIDASRGIVHQRMPKENIEAAYAALPASGFYDTLEGFGPRLYGNDILRIFREMISILKW